MLETRLPRFQYTHTTARARAGTGNGRAQSELARNPGTTWRLGEVLNTAPQGAGGLLETYWEILGIYLTSPPLRQWAPLTRVLGRAAPLSAATRRHTSPTTPLPESGGQFKPHPLSSSKGTVWVLLGISRKKSVGSRSNHRLPRLFF